MGMVSEVAVINDLNDLITDGSRFWHRPAFYRLLFHLVIVG